ncbi:hypothetical protein E3N88_17621 [Mikania micrantha]|uniref:Uncharacterized protein n=1 Tax=Mikania micrantha TaxID=192012 RepID=A0A5N6NUL2_9ASTR|nr:hypothetical protein E3N88_17621 [Mikania micrantha]
MSRRSDVDSTKFFYIAILKWIFNAHVGALWMMSLVVTVLEDNMSGLKAINRAWDLMKEDPKGGVEVVNGDDGGEVAEMASERRGESARIGKVKVAEMASVLRW